MTTFSQDAPDWDNLRLATQKALRGKRAKLDARHFQAHLDANLVDLRRQLLRGDVQVGMYHQFTIFDPKERLITAPCFGERVLHHAIMTVCEPVFERGLIANTFACRQGKGRIACLLRAQEYARRHTHFLKLDIRKYFDSIRHDTLNRLLARRFKNAELLALFHQIIAAYGVAEGRSLPIGSLMSQHFANFYLSGCDRFVSEQLRLPGFVRYMDDMAIWADSAAELREGLTAIADYLSTQMGLQLKPEPYLNRTRHGLDFLGCRVFPSHLILNSRSRRRYRRKLTALDSAWGQGDIGEADAQRRAEAIVAFARTTGVKSWRFQRQVVQQLLGDSLGLGPRTAGR